VESRQYKYISKKSAAYKGRYPSEVTTKDTFKISKPSVNEETPDNLSQRCFRFRAAIENICGMCGEQTTKAGAKESLTGLCAAIENTQLQDTAQWTSPERTKPQKVNLSSGPDELAETTPNVLNLTSTFLISLFAGSAATLAMHRFFRGAPTASQEPLLK